MASNMTRATTNNDENVFPDEVKQRILRPRVAQVVPKRSALSVINDNVQPSRTGRIPAAIKKPTVPTLASSRSGIPVPNILRPATSTFSIFEDKSREIEKSKLPDNVVKLYKYEPEPVPAPISPIKSDDGTSPMVLDTSIGQETEDVSPKEQLFSNSIYKKDIYEYLRNLETKFRPNPAYIRKQPDITLSMRSILVDWLVEVVEEYKMHTETLYLAISYIDRFLSHMSVLKSKLQLVGTACMFIASKYEEIYPPELKDFVYITDDTYTKKQVLRMEHLILKVLAFDLTSPTAYYFLQYICTVSEVPDKVRCLAQYVCELSLLESEPFLAFLPSEIAVSALCLAKHTLEQEPWSKELEEITGYRIQDLSKCVECLYKRYSSISTYPQQAITDKYKSSRYHCVSTISPPSHLNFQCD